MNTPDRPIRLALVGIGKIARAQHLPALRASPSYALQATVSRHGAVDGIHAFPDLDTLLASRIPLDAVSLCTPPQGRHVLASKAIDAGLHVMLEKPPGTSVAAVLDLAGTCAARGRLALCVLALASCGRRRAGAKVAGCADASITCARPGRRTSASGIPGRSGSSKRAALACSIPASIACRF